MYRIRDPVLGDAPGTFDEGVLDAPVATPEVIMQSDCVIIGGPGRQGRMCAEVSYFFDSLTEFQTNGCLLKGKVGSAFTSVGGVGRGYGGHEAILQSFHGFFLQHGMTDDSHSWVVNGDSSLAMVLANAEYDVFLGNFRGNYYGRRHNALNPDEDPILFFDYSFIEHGLDVTAMLNKV